MAARVCKVLILIPFFGWLLYFSRPGRNAVALQAVAALCVSSVFQDPAMVVSSVGLLHRQSLVVAKSCREGVLNPVVFYQTVN